MFLTLLPFPGSAFVATATMPTGLRQFAEYQPFTPVTTALRGLLTGGPIRASGLTTGLGVSESLPPPTCGHGGFTAAAPAGERIVRGSSCLDGLTTRSRVRRSRSVRGRPGEDVYVHVAVGRFLMDPHSTGPEYSARRSGLVPSRAAGLATSALAVRIRTEDDTISDVTTLNSDEIRIPRHAREAVARHEQVMVFNRERPVLAIVHPDDLRPRPRRGRPVAEIAAALVGVPAPDPDFGPDMEAVIAAVGPTPWSPWER